jgi:predicted nucleic acid-binding protein
MESAFWDSSSLVPLCVRQVSTPIVQTLSRQCGLMVVWWTAPVEILGAFTRLIRMGQMSSNEHVQAQVRLDRMRRNWREIYPDESLRSRAESLVGRFPLTSADGLQLAAALAWCLGHPRNRPFISGDTRLLDAARQLGFQPIQG